MFSLYFVSFSCLILLWMQCLTKVATSIPASYVQLVLGIIHHVPTCVENFVIYVVLSLSRDDFTFAVSNSSVSFYFPQNLLNFPLLVLFTHRLAISKREVGVFWNCSFYLQVIWRLQCSLSPRNTESMCHLRSNFLSLLNLSFYLGGYGDI